MFTSTVIDPKPLAAVILYNVRFLISVGVPLSTPVEESKNNPADNSGVIDQSVMAPPVESGSMFNTVELLRSNSSEGTYAIIGTWSRTEIEMVVEISPAELFAQTVNVMAECIPVGVPVISPVTVLKESPGIEEGTSGEMPQLSGAPPTLVGVSPVICSFLVNVNGEPAYEISAASS